jgi:hypothetical protein
MLWYGAGFLKCGNLYHHITYIPFQRKANKSMENNRKYIVRAEEIARSLDIPELQQAGILRDGSEYDFIVQYPPPLTLAQAKENEIFG